MLELKSPEELFDEGIERYKSGESIGSLISLFESICDRSSKNGVSWTCLAWLYLLEGKGSQAVKAAKKAVKLNPQDPQARINLALGLLETKQKGVREHIDIARQIFMVSSELREEVYENLMDGLNRKPNWDAIHKIQGWLFE